MIKKVQWALMTKCPSTVSAASFSSGCKLRGSAMKRNSVFGFFSLLLLVCAALGLTVGSGQNLMPPYKNPSLPVERRVDDLVSRMTLEEKVSQMMNAAPAIPRLGIPEYDWWNEGLHGVGFSGVATVWGGLCVPIS